MNDKTQSTQLLVIGAGPGGYPAAFHAADMGMDVVLVDKDPQPGGVCLYRGCIPSKAILHAASAIQLADEAAEMGIHFEKPQVDWERLREWKQSVVEKLTSGLGELTRQRGIHYLQGTARFREDGFADITAPDGSTSTVAFEHAIVASGSEPVRPGFIPKSQRIMDSTAALALQTIPESLLVMGGGYIGLELGQAYASLGVRVSVVEMQATILPGVDLDLVKPLARHIKSDFHEIMLSTRVAEVVDTDEALAVTMEQQGSEAVTMEFDSMLVAIGRQPVTAELGLENVNVDLTDDGFIKVDDQRFTSNPSIQAVGDIAGQPLLAHKATHEGRSAVEALNDGKAIYDPRAIPAVVFTDPEIAWCGAMEDELRRTGADVKTAVFPWEASGRAATLARSEGVTKLLTDAASGQILGVGIAGKNAGEIIGEAVLAMEMGAVAEDLALTIHAHPSLSETLMEAAQQAMGQSTHFFKRI